MPTRRTRPRKNEGLKQYITPLYERPALRFLSGQPYADVAALIFGLHTSRPDPAEVERLKPLWAELRDAILEAHVRYMPGKKPWAARFDRKVKK